MFVPRCLRSSGASDKPSMQRSLPLSHPQTPPCITHPFVPQPAASYVTQTLSQTDHSSPNRLSETASNDFCLERPFLHSEKAESVSARSSDANFDRTGGEQEQPLGSSSYKPELPQLSICPDEESPIKDRSEQQREAEPGEPSCIICGRYGEYICDETDEDVCSLQCKALALERKVKSSHSEVHVDPSVSLSTALPNLQAKDIFLLDECIYVKDKEQKLPEWETVNPLTNYQADKLRQEMEVQVKGESVPAPILEFTDCNFPPRLQSNLELAGFVLPTPVQMQVIPAALKGRNILVRSDTGSGKTASFLLPVVTKCWLVRSRYVLKREKPLAIVMTPTRELCSQVEEQAKVFGKGLPFKTALVVGGDALPQQVYRLNQGVELIVGTPGRLVDLLTKHPIDLDDVCILVLDEVDCMLDRGFRDQVMQVVRALSQPQMMMFSATISPNVEKLAHSLLKRPITISVGNSNVPSTAVKQTVIWVESKKKKQKLFEILQSPFHYHPPLVVFVSSREGADLLAETICHMTGLKAVAIHGEKKMCERRQLLRSFVMGEVPIVVATGVLGRGLDLIRVKQVIVFDMPNSLHDYVHQIGRASRLGTPGKAMVFINNESKGIFKSFIDLLHSCKAVVPAELANSPYVHSSYAAAYHHKRQKCK